MYYKKSLFQNVKIPEVTLGKIFPLAAKFMHFVVFFDVFPKKRPIFPKNVGFFGEPLGKRLFPSDSRRIFAPAFSKIGAAN